MINNLFTKGYIEKSVNNPDLQNMWEPKEGHYHICPCKACRNRNAEGGFIHDYDIDALTKRNLDNLELTYKNMIKFYGQTFIDHYKECRNTISYIPRQDELQLILKQKIERFKNMNDLKFDFNMRQCISEIYCHKLLSILTLNDMWLIFFMKQLFEKMWIPESKSWENDNGYCANIKNVQDVV